MQLASCFIPRTNSLKCVVQLCRNVFFFFCATYAFVRSFFSFFFLSFFLFHFFSPPPMRRVSLGRSWNAISMFAEDFFFFFFSWSESTRFRFLKRINRRLNRCSRLGADERTIVWSRIGDGVLFDSFILDRAPRVIRFFWEVSAREEGEFMEDFFFFFFFPPSDFWKQLTTAGILIYSTVKVIFQCFGTKIEFLGIKLIRLWIIISQECVELHNAIESKSHNTLYTAVVLRLKTGSYNSISCDDKNI